MHWAHFAIFSFISYQDLNDNVLLAISLLNLRWINWLLHSLTLLKQSKFSVSLRDCLNETQWQIYIVIFLEAPTPDPICFIFMQFSANFCQIMGRRPLSDWRTLWVILDPSLKLIFDKSTWSKLLVKFESLQELTEWSEFDRCTSPKHNLEGTDL